MVCHHRISSPCEYRRMMCPEPLEVTRTSLATYCTSLCNSNSRNPYSLNKGLLVKYWWCLTSTPWTTPMSSPSTSYLHMSNDKLRLNAVSLRCKHSLETLFAYRKFISYIKSYSTKTNFFFLFYFIFIYLFIFLKTS